VATDQGIMVALNNIMVEIGVRGKTAAVLEEQ